MHEVEFQNVGTLVLFKETAVAVKKIILEFWPEM